MKLCFQQTAIGRIGIGAEDGMITHLYFASDTPPQQIDPGESDIVREAFRQLDAYLAGALQTFSLPLNPCGTDFMRTVWKALCTIPYGTTASYRDIAVATGHPKAARAVGLANNRNPIPLFIPCHRIIGANGKLTGYRGGLELKKKLLALEQRASIP